jgi:hypothetical protein
MMMMMGHAFPTVRPAKPRPSLAPSLAAPPSHGGASEAGPSILNAPALDRHPSCT